MNLHLVQNFPYSGEDVLGAREHPVRYRLESDVNSNITAQTNSSSHRNTTNKWYVLLPGDRLWFVFPLVLLQPSTGRRVPMMFYSNEVLINNLHVPNQTLIHLFHIIVRLFV